jgi:protease I
MGTTLRGRTLTSWPGPQTDITNAGATWHDERVVVCGSGPSVLVTSRGPTDLPAFRDAAVERFAAVGPR